jgi:F-type H+-transporting ATPase subunit gamma
MANVLDLRRRIRSVKNTRQITKAMKMVSAAKLRRAQERALSSRPYAQMLATVLESLDRRSDIYSEKTGNLLHPLLLARPEHNILVLVVSGDKGFAGAFNSNILKAAQSLIDARTAAGQSVDVEPVGRKARDYFRKRYPIAQYTHTTEHSDNDLTTHRTSTRTRNAPVEVTGDHPGILTRLKYDDVQALCESIIARYESAEIDAVYLVFNEFKSVISQRIVVEKLLPISKVGEHEITAAEEMSREAREQAGHAAATAGISLKAEGESDAEREARKFGTAQVDYLYDQQPERLYRHLMPRYVSTQVFHSMLESVAAEHAARMTAMDAATNNAGDMIDALSLTMNRVRQAAITKEIIEIVSGAAAL